VTTQRSIVEAVVTTLYGVEDSVRTGARVPRSTQRM
jgi:hypothetical protein